MCGIIAVFDIKGEAEALRPQVLQMARSIRHRGPDWSGNYCSPGVVMAHERLAIVDPQSGRQPLFSEDKSLVLAVNGEIYNHQELRTRSKGYAFQTHSDCEVILALYQEKQQHFLEDLRTHLKALQWIQYRGGVSVHQEGGDYMVLLKFCLKELYFFRLQITAT
jgi:asparagine synthase (glutamine-hydrolysing)